MFSKIAFTFWCSAFGCQAHRPAFWMHWATTRAAEFLPGCWVSESHYEHSSFITFEQPLNKGILWDIFEYLSPYNFSKLTLRVSFPHVVSRGTGSQSWERDRSGMIKPHVSTGVKGQESLPGQAWTPRCMGKGAAVAWAKPSGRCFPKPALHQPVYQTESTCFQHSLRGEVVVWMGEHVKERPWYYGARHILATDPSWSHSSGLSCRLCRSIPEPTISVQAGCLLFDKW